MYYTCINTRAYGGLFGCAKSINTHARPNCIVTFIKYMSDIVKDSQETESP